LLFDQIANRRNLPIHRFGAGFSGACLSPAVHLYGTVAVATGIYQDKIKEKGKAVVRSGRFTDTWMQQNGEWKWVASQATLIS
jgi:hypothetical protein